MNTRCRRIVTYRNSLYICFCLCQQKVAFCLSDWFGKNMKVVSLTEIHKSHNCQFRRKIKYCYTNLRYTWRWDNVVSWPLQHIRTPMFTIATVDMEIHGVDNLRVPAAQSWPLKKWWSVFQLPGEVAKRVRWCFWECISVRWLWCLTTLSNFSQNLTA